MEEERKEGQPSTPRELLERLKGNRQWPSLYVDRIPPKTKEAFQKLAMEEFCSDYGMTLKWLMDDIISQDMKAVLAKLEEHEQRISNLEALAKKMAESQEGKDHIDVKMLDGKTIRVVKND